MDCSIRDPASENHKIPFHILTWSSLCKEEKKKVKYKCRTSEKPGTSGQHCVEHNCVMACLSSSVISCCVELLVFLHLSIRFPSVSCFILVTIFLLHSPHPVKFSFWLPAPPLCVSPVLFTSPVSHSSLCIQSLRFPSFFVRLSVVALCSCLCSLCSFPSVCKFFLAFSLPYSLSCLFFLTITEPAFRFFYIFCVSVFFGSSFFKHKKT